MSDTYGLTSFEPLASYDPATHSWKMYAVTSLWGLTECLPTLPPSGITQNGNLYQLHRLVRHTDEKDSSLWPTPTTNNSEHPEMEVNHQGRRKPMKGATSYSIGLADAVKRWPTPTASSWGSTGHRMILESRVIDGTISAKEKQQMTSGNGGKLNPTWVEWLMGFPLGWTDLEDSETQ